MSSEIAVIEDVTPSKRMSNLEWIDRIKEEAKQLKKQHERQKPMKRVPQLLKNKDEDGGFEPLLVSIGPYHHGDDRFEQMERLKPFVAKKFLKGMQMGEVFNRFEAEMRAKAIGGFYERGDDDDGRESGAYEEDLVRMMFLDGCFVLHFIDCRQGDEFTHCEIKTYKAFLQQDLFLLENQIPFVVLEALLSRFPEGDKQEKLRRVHGFVQDNTGAVIPPERNPDDHPPPLHLLELLRRHLIGPATGKKKQNEKPSPEKPRKKKAPSHLIRGAKEMLEVGIRFKHAEASALNRVGFVSHTICSDLYLPSMIVDDSTKKKLLNLIAYEMCQDISSDFNVRSYVCFVDSLIDTAEDVKALRESGVLNNFLGSDELVAEIFNSIAHGFLPDHVFKEVEEHIQTHYKKHWTTWISRVSNQHFSTPWAFVALIAGVLELFFTGVQAYYALNPRSESEGDVKAKKNSRSSPRAPSSRYATRKRLYG